MKEKSKNGTMYPIRRTKQPYCRRALYFPFVIASASWTQALDLTVRTYPAGRFDRGTW